MGSIQIVQLISDATNPNVDFGFKGVSNSGLFEDIYGFIHTVLFFIDFAEVEIGLNCMVVPQRGRELLFCFFKKVEVIVALPQSNFPPGILKIVDFGGNDC
jgi:hypothetical protein